MLIITPKDQVFNHPFSTFQSGMPDDVAKLFTTFVTFQIGNIMLRHSIGRPGVQKKYYLSRLFIDTFHL